MHLAERPLANHLQICTKKGEAGTQSGEEREQSDEGAPRCTLLNAPSPITWGHRGRGGVKATVEGVKERCVAPPKSQTLNPLLPDPA